MLQVKKSIHHCHWLGLNPCRMSDSRTHHRMAIKAGVYRKTNYHILITAAVLCDHCARSEILEKLYESHYKAYVKRLTRKYA